MASYFVLTPPRMTDPEKQTLFIRDGFSWFAFLLPLPWLLVRRLWLIAALSVFLYVLAVLASEYWGLEGLPLAYTVILCLWTGLEGGYTRATALRRRGWEMQASIDAETLDDAESLYFSELPPPQASEPQRGLFGGPVPQHPSHAVALGLIGPYGSR